MKIQPVASALLTLSLLIPGMPASADDGAITNKSMSRTIALPDFEQEIVNEKIPEAEHAFTDMMGFYVPSQRASGLLEPIDYCDVDNQPASGEDCTNPVETLEVARPLVNVFIYGPKFAVPDTAFGHSFMDTYAAISLDDGETFKQINLSESADLSSFNLETDHNPSGPGSGDPLPGDHNIPLPGPDFGVLHARGFDTPYSAECTECHGRGLQGVAEIPSCYRCHDQKWTEPTPIETGPIIVRAVDNAGALSISGVNAASGAAVSILNAITGVSVGLATADADGKFTLEDDALAQPPCIVIAEYTDNTGDDLTGPSLTVRDATTGDPVQACEGSPVNLTEYPGGTYNVFQATAGNKTLVAWPSRFCSSGQPAYTMTTDSGLEDPDQQARLTAITEFIRAGDEALGVPALPDFTSTIDGEAVDDLYLVDVFGVAGNQGSIDFADEGYPQAGVVPFGCVWTARGVLLPGDDPRTDEVESTHMVWTKAERLTSGRRDVNRIEVSAVKGAGFVVTWQEDPEGLRPGQGLGPGEGWSGAVAHSQTDGWYSFINEEYFDIVELDGETTTPIDILDHDLTVSGRPQVFVPMAVPMRFSNNAKCNPPDTVTAGGGTEDLYCLFDDVDTDNIPVGASAFGLRDQCADTVTIQTGNENNPTETEICVADSFDGIEGADLPNRANTALTRPRLSLQGYDLSDTDRSAWVVIAAEESKGLGNTFFEPDGLNGEFDGYADPCEEGSSLSCAEEIGKNQWYYSFDMGTPDTSAGIDDPNSLVSNLVSQGNMLNQGEVYWETGELLGFMRTEDITDYGVYNFDILNTEIARRASLLVQSVEDKASGLSAIASWKQGPMRQGGPADTMLRRFQQCPVNVEDENGPVIEKVDWVQYLADGKNIKIKGRVANLDDIKKTGFFIRDASTEDEEEYIFFVENTAPKDWENFLAENIDYPPCYIQASDEDPDVEGQSVGNWGPVFDLREYWEEIGVECECGRPTDTALVTSSVTPALEQEAARNASWKSKLADVFGMVLDVVIPMAHAADNPYAFDNMVCEEWLIEADTNPYYPGGVCADPAINLSAVVPDTCIDDADGSSIPCPTVDFSTSTYGIGDTDPILQGQVQGEGNTMRVLTWHQCPSDYTVLDSDLTDALDCETDDRTDDFVNLLDQSWYNPLDISKGHRGFLNGDFVMFLYAWSPNWRLNAKGNDRYDLYVRRSFDGGETWTTTPASFTASDGLSYSGDGTVTCESYRPETTVPGERDEPTACYEFAAGANEHARNVTQHRSMNITTLDPRYAATRATIEEGCTDGLFVDNTVIDGIFTCDDLSEEHDADERDPSRYFMVFETGDNTTVEVGEAEPLDLFYSRAESFGDDYVVWAETDTDTADPTLCYPSDPHGDDFVSGTVVEGSGFCNEFDRMNRGGDTRSSEANLEANPDGSRLYSVWAQWVLDEAGDEVIESDAMARRIWWIDDYISDTFSWTLPGTQQP